MFKLWGHRAIFTFFCNNLLKTCFWCYRTRKLTHILKLYFGNFYRAFTKSNNYVAAMLTSVTLMPFELWSCWGIHEQSEVFYWVKHFCIQAVGKLITDWRYCSIWYIKIDSEINLKMNLKIDSSTVVFSCESCETFKNTIL